MLQIEVLIMTAQKVVNNAECIDGGPYGMIVDDNLIEDLKIALSQIEVTP